MGVLLINPPADRKIESWDLPKYPNISLGYLASALEKNKINVDVVDAKLERLSFTETIKRFNKKDYDLVGLTAFTHEINQAANLASAIKKINPKTIIIIGGVHVTVLPKETLEQFPEFDFVIIGEGEEITPTLIKNIKNKKEYSKIKGVAYRDKNKVIINNPKERIQNLDKLAFPAWHLFPRSEEYQIITARGCPYSCIFCMSPYGKMVRERSPENVISEIGYVMDKYHPKIYKLNDETFGFNLERANKILDLIIEKEFHKRTKFMASMRADKINRAIVEKMKKASFIYIDLGVESGNETVLKRIKKGVTLKQTYEAVKMIKEVGVKVGVNVIIGHPYETRETANQTINYAVKLNGDITAIGLMVPYPGTEVAEMVEKGVGGYKLLSLDWNDYNKQVGNALELENLSRNEMEKLQAMGYLKIYLYNLRIIDLIKFIWTYKNAGLLFLKKQLNLAS